MTAVVGLRIEGGSQGLTPVGAGSNFSLNATGIVIAWVVQAESVEPITHVWFRGGARTGTPPTYVITIEGIDSSGNPDGTDIGGGSPTAATFTPPADTTWNGVGRWIAVTNSWTPTLGQLFAIVVRYSSGTCDGSNFFSFTSGVTSINYGGRNFPYCDTYNGSAWTKSTQSFSVAWKGATGVYGFPATGAVTSSGSLTAGRRIAAAVTIPTAHASSFTCLAFEGIMDPGSAAGTVVFGVWDASGTELSAITLDTDAMASVIGRNIRIIMDTHPALTCGTEYYFGMEATVGGAPGIQGLTMGSADDRAAFPNGLNKSMATWDGSSWTKDTLVLPLIEITAADLTLPSGGSGGALILGGLGQTGIGSF